MNESQPLSSPPEGVLAGENVPAESEPDQYDQQKIEEVMALLKIRGEPYISMSDYELRERALEYLHKYGDI